MGVQNLWQLLLPIGRRINIETLEGKALAVDVSIWLIQFIRVMRDEEGKMVKNAHLIGTLRRILKLLFHRIRPVFVFDGATPELKRRTVQHRRVLRERQEHNLRKAAEKILVAQLKQAALAAKLNETGAILAIAPPAPAQPAQYSSSFVASSRGTAGAGAGAGVSAAAAATSQSSTAAETGGGDENDEDFDNIAWESAEETVNVRPKPLDDDAASSDSEDAWFVPDNELDIDVDALAALPAHIRKEMILIARRRHRLKARADFVPVSEDPAMYSQTQIAHFLRTSRLNERIYEVQQRTSSMESGRTIAASENRKYIIMKDDEFVSDVEEERVDADGAVASTHTHSNTATHSAEVVVSSSPSSPSQRGGRAEEIAAAPAVIELEEEDDWETAGGGFFGDEVTNGSLHSVKPVEPPTTAAAAVAEETKEGTQADKEASKQAEGSQPKPRPMTLDENGDWVDAEERLRLARRKKRVEFVDMSSEHDEASEAVKRLRELAERSKKQKAVTTPVVEAEDAESEAPEPAPEVDDGSFWEDATTIAPPVSTQKAPQTEPVVEAAERSGDEAVAAVTVAEDSTPIDSKRKEPVIVIRFERPAPSTLPPTTMPLAASIQPSADFPKQPDERTELISQSVIEEAPESQVSETVTTAAFTKAAETTQEETQEEQEAEATHEYEDEDADEHEEEEEELQGRSSDEPLINDPALMARINEEMSQLEHERDLLQQQRRAAMRDTERMTEEMKEEVLEMLQVLGLPYIVAPMEAEAQCAVLEALGVVDGVVTEDSDAFLFGAQTVYKNIFDERKYVEVFLASDAERELGINRNEFIALAFLLGSDYTPGVRGVGIVNAMEVLHAFPCKEDPIEGLKEFKKWLGGFDITEELGLKGTEADSLDNIKRQFHQKHRGLRSRWQADDNFPDERVAKAYLRPQVVSDATRFEWPVPEIVRVKEYCRQRLGWTDAEIDKTVVPAIANFATTKVQKRIDSYYVSYHDNIQFARIRSNRLRTAVGSMTGQVPEPSSRLVPLPGTVVGGKRSMAQSDSPVRAAGSGADTTPKRQRKQRRRKAAASWEDSTSDSEAEPSPEERGATGKRQRRKRKSG